MDPIEIMKRPAPYASGHENAPAAAQLRAKRLCWEYNRTAPDEAERRGEILTSPTICPSPWTRRPSRRPWCAIS